MENLLNLIDIGSLMPNATEITPTRFFNWAYVIFDCIFLCALLALLIWKKRYMTLIHSIAFGLMILCVDFFFFYLIGKTRHIYLLQGSDWVECSTWQTFAILFWFSFAYGIPNAIFIYMALNKDKYLIHFSAIIFGWWMAVPSISKVGGDATICTYRGTGNYHWIMGLILCVSYGIFICYQMKTDKKLIGLVRLNVIGILAQFSWEFAILVNGIRPMNEMSIPTLLVNSFIETNMGMPFFYFLNAFLRKRRNEDLSPVVREAIKELN